MSRKGSAVLLACTVVLTVMVLPVMTKASQREDRKEILKRLEEDTNRFKKSLDSALDHGPLDGTKAEDEINEYVDSFRDASKRLRDRYKDQKYAMGDANEVLVRAKRINGFMRKYPLTSEAQSNWQMVRNDLELLARTYNITWSW